MATVEMNALALEYKRYYGTARRNVNITDIMNNPNVQGIPCIFGPGFSEETTNLPVVKRCTVPDDRADSSLVL